MQTVGEGRAPGDAVPSSLWATLWAEAGLLVDNVFVFIESLPAET